MSPFGMTDMGNMSFILGMQVTRDSEKGTLTISRQNDTKSVLEVFGVGNCIPLSTPEFDVEQLLE